MTAPTDRPDASGGRRGRRPTAQRPTGRTGKDRRLCRTDGQTIKLIEKKEVTIEMFPVFNKEAYSWKHPIRNIRYFFVDCKNSLQRIRRGYSDEDAAMFCVWFRCVVPAMLRSYRRQLDANPGFPGVLVWEFYEEHERDMGFSYETFISSSATPDPAVTVWQERMEKECRKKWESIVDDMILLFSESDEDTCHRYNPYDREREGDAYIKEEQVLADYRDECLKRAFGLLGTWLDDLLL